MPGHLLPLAYFMAPAYCANMAAPLVKFWRGWNRPIHEAWFGSHKTILGFCAGVTTALVVTIIQRLIGADFSLLDYSSWFPIGLAFGVGAMGGDAVKSFCKRRLGLAPGTRWIPMDQVDFALGALIATRPWIALGPADTITILAVTFIADLAVNRIAFHVGIKDTPW